MSERARRVELLPPRDLLEQHAGIEQGLRRGRVAGRFGWVVLLVSILGTADVAALREWTSAAQEFDPQALLSDWFFYVSAGLIFGSVALITWNRFWIQQSRDSFRYTFAIAPFADLTPDAAQGSERLAFLRADLAEKLSERIMRLSYSEEGAVAGGGLSHIRVRGEYAIRERPRGLLVEVTPWVHIGAGSGPDTLAEPVKFQLDADRAIDAARYEQIVERVYFSVATQIYKRIKEDVKRKIELLPARSYRAAAYFYEAQDYARSDTLDAYEEARDLYQAAIALYKRRPPWRPEEPSPVRRWVLHRTNELRAVGRWLLIRSAWLWPGLGHTEVLVARAKLGYAKMLLYRRQLAGLSGMRGNPIFAARPVARSAIEALDRPLPPNVPARDDACLEGFGVLALACADVGDVESAHKYLADARRFDPMRVGSEPFLLFTAAHLERDHVAALKLLRSAVDLVPKFQAAQFALALRGEKLWRQKSPLEAATADLFMREYRKLVDINPGIVAAWANLGYVLWLLGKPQDARKAFASGREFKEIKRETFVSELDYGLARIASEAGDVVEAYERYVDAVSALLAEGVEHSSDQAGHYFVHIGPELMGRFDEYLDQATTRIGVARRTGIAPPRVCDSVRAFVLNDHAEACWTYYQRTGELDRLRQARDELDEAIRINSDFVLPHFNRYRINLFEGRLRDALKDLETVKRLDSRWPDGILALAELKARIAADEAAERAEQPDVERALRAEEKERRAGFAHLESLYAQANGADGPVKEADELGEVRALIQILVPHKRFETNGPGEEAVERFLMRTLVGVRGPDVPEWESDITDLHVRAFITWARVLSLQHDALDDARRLCTRIRERYWPYEFEALKTLYDAIAGLLQAHERPATDSGRRRLPSLPGRDKREVERARLLQELDECRDAISSKLDLESKADESSYALGTWYLWLARERLEREEPDVPGAREAVRRAREAAIRPALTLDFARTLIDVASAAPSEANALDEACRALEGLASADGEGDLQIAARTELVRAAWARGSFDEVVKHLTVLARLRRSEPWRAELIQRQLDVRPSLDGYRRLKTWLLEEKGRARLAEATSSPEARAEAVAWRRDAEDAFSVLVRTGYPDAASQGVHARPEPVMPLVVDAHPALVDELAGPRLLTMILMGGGVGTRVAEQTGVRIPAVVLRPAPDLAEREYFFRLHDVPLENGVAAPAGAAGVHEHLERFVMKRLDSLIGLDETEVMLGEWAGDDEARLRLVREAVPTERAHVQFVRVVQRLLRDRVPVRRLDVLLETFASGTGGIREVAERARSALRSELPGNADGRRPIPLPRAVEARVAKHVRGDVGTGVLEVDVAATERLLLGIGAAVGSADPREAVLVVNDPALRRFVRQLVERRWPELPVVAAGELERPRSGVAVA